MKSKLLTRRWIVRLIAGGLLIASGCTTPPMTYATATVATVERAPTFQLPTLTGETIHLADLQGRYVLINFWATWCLPCREEMPYLQQLAATHADQLTVLGINMRESSAEIQPYVDELGITFPILIQPDDEMLLGYSVRGLPLSFVIAPSGELIFQQVGPLEAERFDLWLKEQLEAKPVTWIAPTSSILE